MKTIFLQHYEISEERMIEIFQKINEMPEPGFISVGETFNNYKHLLLSNKEKCMFYNYIIEASNLCLEAKKYYSQN